MLFDLKKDYYIETCWQEETDKSVGRAIFNKPTMYSQQKDRDVTSLSLSGNEC